MKINQKIWFIRISLCVCAFASVVLFQNCGTNFESKTTGGANNTVASTPTLTAPTIVLSSNPDLVNLNSYSIQFSISGISRDLIQSVTCQLKNELAQDCLSGSIKYSNLTDGDHSVLIKATTTSNISSEVIKLFRIDTTPPIIVVATPPPERSSERSMSIGFNVTDTLSGVNKSECSFDNEAYATCTSPKSFTNLLSGPHTLKMRSSDMAGNVSLVKELAWTVDFSIPTVTISQAQAAFSNSTSASFTFSGAAIATYQCQVDGLGFADCVSPKTFTGLIAGNHKFEVKGKNATGTSSAVAQSLWKIDQTAPSIPILTQNVKSITNQKSAQFNFSATDDSGIAKYDCVVDGKTSMDCKSPNELLSLGDGQHKIEVISYDSAGNTSASSFNWLVDTQAPSLPKISLKVASPAVPNSNEAVIEFSSSENGLSGFKGFSCSVDGTPVLACTSPLKVIVSPGNHQISVLAADNAGNSAVSNFTWVMPPLGPGQLNYKNLSWDDLFGKAYPSQIFIDGSNQKAYVHSACGIFSNDSNGQFSSVQLPGIKNPPLPNSLFVDNGTIYYVDQREGLMRKRPSESKFSIILDNDGRQKAMDANPFPCSSIGLGGDFTGQSVYASGDQILLGSTGLFVSNDAGLTWTWSKMKSGNYQVSPPGISSIHVKNGKIYLSTVNGDGRSSNVLNSAGQCEMVDALSGYGLLVSSDGGKEFNALSAAGMTNLSVVASGTSLYTMTYLTNSERGFSFSNDEGKTFSNITLPTNVYIANTSNLIAVVGNDIFVSKNNGSTSILNKSTDGGKTFSEINLPTQTENFYITSMRSSGENLYVLTTSGLYVSSDSGLTFPKITKFSSDFCTFPYGRGFYTGGGSGNSIYLGGGNAVLYSTDGGTTFSKTPGQPFTIKDIQVTGDALFGFAQGLSFGIIATFDSAKTFSSIQNSITDPTTGAAGFMVNEDFVEVPGGHQSGVYLSSDGSNQLYQLKSYTDNGYRVVSAYSNKLTIVASIVLKSDAHHGGLVTFSSGKEIYINMNVLHGGDGVGSKIRYINGVFYSLGRYLISSRDNGQSFNIVPTAPMESRVIYGNSNGVLHALSDSWDFISTDNGVSFRPWVAEFK